MDRGQAKCKRVNDCAGRRERRFALLRQILRPHHIVRRRFRQLSPSLRTLIAAWVGALLLNACSVLPDAPRLTAQATLVHADSFAILGRFSLTHAEKTYVGRLNWRHDGPNDTLILSSPLGQALAEIVSDASSARMTQRNGQIQTADSAAQLIESLLGYPLPLDKLVDWLRGSDGRDGQRSYDASGRLQNLQDTAWRIDYEYDADDKHALPARLFVERADGLRLRLRIEEWETSTPSASSR